MPVVRDRIVHGAAFRPPASYSAESYELPKHREGHLKLTNAHPRDAALHFIEETHEYFWRREVVVGGKRVARRQKTCGSVSKLADVCCAPFDGAKVVDAMRRSRDWPRLRYMRPLAELRADESLPLAIRHAPDLEAARALARSLGLADEVSRTKAAILAGWKAFGAEMANMGTQAHLDIELWQDGEPVDQTSDHMRLFLSWATTCPEVLRPYRTEWEVFGEEENIAGSIDAVFRDDRGGFVIVDWKRTKELEKECRSFRGRRMGPPLAHLEDCKGVKYALQLNLYRFILEKYYGMRIHRLLLVCVHPDCGERPFVKEVDLMPSEASELMGMQRARAKRYEAMAPGGLAGLPPWEAGDGAPKRPRPAPEAGAA